MSVFSKGDAYNQKDKKQQKQDSKNELQKAMDNVGNTLQNLFTSKEKKWKKKGVGHTLGDATQANTKPQPQTTHTHKPQNLPPPPRVLNPAAQAAAQRAEQRAAASSTHKPRSTHSATTQRNVENSPAHPNNLKFLCDMGFPSDAASEALSRAGGDMETAVELLSSASLDSQVDPAPQISQIGSSTPILDEQRVLPSFVKQPGTPAERHAAVRDCAWALASKGDSAKPPLNLILRLLRNITENPEEEKYRRVRLRNAKISAALGGDDVAYTLLQLVGFEFEKDLEGAVMSDLAVTETTSCLTLLLEADEAASEAEVGPRDVKVLFSEGVPAPPELPPDFFELTADEARALVAEATAKRQANSVLQTKASRDAEAERKRRKYKAAIIRVRFPDGIILQATFSVHAAVSRVLVWVTDSLDKPHCAFELSAARCPPLSDPSATVGGANLAPASLLNFRLVHSAGACDAPYLTKDLLERVEVLGNESLPNAVHATS